MFSISIFEGAFKFHFHSYLQRGRSKISELLFERVSFTLKFIVGKLFVTDARSCLPTITCGGIFPEWISEDERKEKGNYACRYDCMLFKNTRNCI